ncbi:MAG: hypothetical protein ABSE49_21470 [Polyangiaceae bacterium]
MKDSSSLADVRCAIPRARPTCQSCRRRPALTRIHGDWRVVKDHDVCRQCWRTFIDAARASMLPRSAGPTRHARGYLPPQVQALTRCR